MRFTTQVIPPRAGVGRQRILSQTGRIGYAFAIVTALFAWILSGPESGLIYISLSLFVGASIVGVRTVRGQRRGRAMRPMITVGAFALSVLLLLISLRTSRIPVLERYEIMLAAAWVLATGVWILDRQRDQPVLIAVTAPTISLLVVFALLLVPGTDAPNRNAAIGTFVHIGLALVGLAALTFAAAVAFFYLRQIRIMKLDPLQALSMRLPPLQVLDRLNFRAVLVGFPALALGALGGWVFVAHGKGGAGNPWLDPTVIATMTGLAIYALLLFTRTFLGWYGRRIAWMTLSGFLLLVVGFVVAWFCMKPGGTHTTWTSSF